MFWRRKPKDDTPLDAPEDQEDASPEDAPAGWEPDPADFDPPTEGSGRRSRHRRTPPAGADSRRPMSPRTPSRTRSLTRTEPAADADPPPLPASAAPGAIPGWITADDDRPGDLAAGLEKSRTGFIGRLRGFLGTGPDGPSWDDVEETLIAGDVGAALAIDIVERARRRRDPGGPEAAVRAELAALLVPRDADAWRPAAGGPGSARR